MEKTLFKKKFEQNGEKLRPSSFFILCANKIQSKSQLQDTSAFHIKTIVRFQEKREETCLMLSQKIDYNPHMKYIHILQTCVCV